MEHNIERIIREKVNTVENLAPSWQKENVWLSIENNFETKHHMPLKYYIAASASLALGLFIFLLQPKNQIGQLNSDVLTKTDHKTETSHEHTKSTASVDECKESGNAISFIVKNKRIKSVQTLDTIILKTVVINTSKTEITELKKLPLQFEKTSDDTTIAKHVEKVHAIFGVEEKPVVTFSTRRQKKVHFRLFKTEDGTSPVSNSGEPVNLLARINKN